MTDNNTIDALKDNPDKDIEFFWLCFKKSIINMFKYIKTENPLPLVEWSDILNNLQKQKNYQQIQINITEYIKQYSYYIIKYAPQYHLLIFKSNINRWNKLSDKYHLDYDKINDDYTCFYAIKISILNRKNHVEYFDKILKHITNFSNDSTSNNKLLYEIMILCVENKDDSILDSIGQVFDIWTPISEIYDIKISHGCKARKILSKLK